MSAPRLGLLETAVLRPGVPVAIVAVSLVGALVVSGAPMRPGARKDLALDAIAGERWVVGVVIVRCWVGALNPVSYCAALEFDATIPEGMGRGYPESA